MMKSLFRLAALSAIALLMTAPIFSSPANAETLTFGSNSTDSFGAPSKNNTVGSVQVLNPATNSLEWTVAGSYNGLVTGGSAAYDDHNIAIYCVDATHNVYWGQQFTVTPVSLFGYSLHGASDAGANDRIAAIFAATYGDPLSPFSIHMSEANWQGGLQMAIWSAEYSGSFAHIPNANVIGPTDAVNDANAILDAAASLVSGHHYLTAYDHLVVFAANPADRVQDQITWVPDVIFSHQNLSPVPEPSSFALLGLGGIGLVFAAFRRRHAVN